MATRLYCILARESPKAVILRRGPSKLVCLISWNREDDTFEIGQWFKGRLYERRCDLSPDGNVFVYFAATYKKPLYTWTAISKPPFLTALALWPKGDGWGGGGLFADNTTLLLNHHAGQMNPHEDFDVSGNLEVAPLGAHAGWGEDDPIHHTRLVRDAWVQTSAGEQVEPDFSAKLVWNFEDKPVVYEKALPGDNDELKLQMKVRGINQPGKSWYAIDYHVVDADGTSLLTLSDTEWCDWDANGDLLYSDGGALMRQDIVGASTPRVLADFSSLTFEEKMAPYAAGEW